MRICAFDAACGRTDLTGTDGWCRRHYNWMLRNHPEKVTKYWTSRPGELADTATGMKTCKRCGLSKDVEAFTVTSHGRIHAMCEECLRISNTERHRRFMSKPDSVRNDRDRKYRKNYGITADDYDRMLAEQGDRCWLCEREADEGADRLRVDHCHSSGRVRGLLCDRCNRMLGFYEIVRKLDPTRVERYLDRGRGAELTATAGYDESGASPTA